MRTKESKERIHIWSEDELRMKMDQGTDPDLYAMDRITKLNKAHDTFTRINRINERLTQPMVYHPGGSTGNSIIFDEGFLGGIGHIVIDMLRDLREVDVPIKEGITHIIRR